MTGNTFKVLSLGQGGSLMVEHLTHHPMIKGSSLAAAICTGREKMVKRSNLPMTDGTFKVPFLGQGW